MPMSLALPVVLRIDGLANVAGAVAAGLAAEPLARALGRLGSERALPVWALADRQHPQRHRAARSPSAP